ncbi:hypothetical protein AAMO2058_001212100 [Amorphochlora amoebiformis]
MYLFNSYRICNFKMMIKRLQGKKPGSEEFYAAAQEIFDEFLDNDGQHLLTSVELRDRKKVEKALANKELNMSHFNKPLRSALNTMKLQLSEFLQEHHHAGVQLSKQRTCMECGLKFKDVKVQKQLCPYCLGIKCDNCMGSGSTALPSRFYRSENKLQQVCRVCYPILEKRFATWTVTGYRLRETGIFAPPEKKGKKDPESIPPPQSMVFGVENEKERDLWIEAIRAASVKGLGGQSPRGSSIIHKEGWIHCKPFWYGKGATLIWTRKYLILHGSVLRVLNLKFGESLPLVAWQVHSFNAISPTTVGPKAHFPDWMITKSRYSYHFSVSNRNHMFKLAADTAENRSRWIKTLQRKLEKKGE